MSNIRYSYVLQCCRMYQLALALLSIPFLTDKDVYSKVDV